MMVRIDRHPPFAALLLLMVSALGACAAPAGRVEDERSDQAPAGTAVSGVEASAFRQIIIALDLSNSRTAEEVEADELVLAEIVGMLRPGDQVVLLEVYSGGRNGAARPWMQELPGRATGALETKNADRLREQELNDLRGEMERMLAGRDTRSPGTDLLATFGTVSELAQDATHRKRVLIVFSDMLQATRGLNMERGALPETGEWLEAQRRDGILPSLAGVCVSVVGPDPLTREGQRVFSFWREYFTATGASLERNRYRKIAMSPAVLLCEGGDTD